MLQEIIAFGILGIALVYIIRKYFFKSKSKKNCGGDDGCGGCH